MAAIKTFHQIKEANAELQRLAAELETAQAALAKANTDHTTALNARDAEHKTAIDAKDAKIKELEGNVTTISGQRDNARNEATAHATKITTLETNAKTVEQRAAEIAATMGAKEPVAAGRPAAAATEDPKARMQEAWGRNFIKR